MTATTELRRVLTFRDLVLYYSVTGFSLRWIATAAAAGPSSLVIWIVAALGFFVPLVFTVLELSSRYPEEGGIYVWSKRAFGPFAAFISGWCYWGSNLPYFPGLLYFAAANALFMGGPAWQAWTTNSVYFIAVATAGLAIAVTMNVVGLDIGKWLHNVGSIGVMTAYVILLVLPLWALLRHSIAHYEPIPWQAPQPSLFSLAIFGQMTVGALSGFEYVAIMAGECRNPARTIGRSVVISAPIIALMFILGTSSVLTFVGTQPINVIGPIPQTMRLAFGAAGWIAPLAISLLLMRAIASASLIFTGLTRLPMTAGWDNLVPPWFARLHPRRQTPVNSILFVTALVMALILLSMMGVREQEASQLLGAASIALYAITYVVLFALPLLGSRAVRNALPVWAKVAALAGLISSAVSLVIGVYPIVDVTSRGEYAPKISAVVVVSNIAGVLIYHVGRRRAASPRAASAPAEVA